MDPKIKVIFTSFDTIADILKTGTNNYIKYCTIQAKRAILEGFLGLEIRGKGEAFPIHAETFMKDEDGIRWAIHDPDSPFNSGKYKYHLWKIMKELNVKKQ